MRPGGAYLFADLFIMRPHPDYLNGFDMVENLVNKAMLDIDSSGESSGKISYKLLVWRWALTRVFSKDVQ